VLWTSAVAGLGSCAAAFVPSASAADKTWTGAVDGSWDLTTGNWLEGTPTVPAGTNTTYAVGDAVYFTDNFAGTNTTIGPVAATTNALSLTFSHVPGTVATTYTFNRGGDLPSGGVTPFGSNAAGVAQVLTLDAGFLGRVILRQRAHANSKGTVTIRSGVLEINDGGALPGIGGANQNTPGTVTLAGGTLVINVNTAGNTQPSSTQLAGVLEVTADSTLVNGATNTTGGPFRVWGSPAASKVNVAAGVTLTVDPGVGGARFDSDFSGSSGRISLGSNSGSVRFGSSGTGGVNATFDTGTGAGIIRAGAATLHLGALTGAAGTFVEPQDSAGPAADTISIGGKNLDATFFGAIRDGANTTTARLASVTKVGTGTQTLAGVNTYGGTTTVNLGTLRVTGSITQSSGVIVNGGTNGSAFEVAATQTIKALTLTMGGTARVSASGTGTTVLTTGSLTLSPSDTGALDIGRHAVIVDYLGATNSALATIRSAIITGYAGGAWNGAGIRSSDAAANPGGAVGYAEASDIVGPAGGTFLGASVDGEAVLVRYTLKGDATLDGKVDFNDLVTLAQNYNTVDGARAWFDGDFTYDGNTDFNDLVLLAQNYNTGLPGAAMSGFSAAFRADLEAAFAQVPEPGAMGLLAAGVVGLIGRRRRR
jgi:autotransporter-associated beta strand protein